MTKVTFAHLEHFGYLPWDQTWNLPWSRVESCQLDHPNICLDMIYHWNPVLVCIQLYLSSIFVYHICPRMQISHKVNIAPAFIIH